MVIERLFVNTEDLEDHLGSSYFLPWEEFDIMANAPSSRMCRCVIIPKVQHNNVNLGHTMGGINIKITQATRYQCVVSILDSQEGRSQ